MRVLVTGAAGSIGQVVTVGLTDRGHDVVGLDLAPQPAGDHWPWHVADCTDPDAVRAVFDEERLDGVVHLAGRPGEAGLRDSFASHVVTTGALLDACVAHDVTRFVYASSNHAVGRTPRGDLLTVDARPRPDTFYGVGKVAAEALLSLYADRYAIDAISCRIGSFLPEPASVRALSTWLSHDDAVRMFDAALTVPAPGYAVLYGISANTRAWWDLEPGRALGYEPLDDAEDFADRIPRAPTTRRRRRTSVGRLPASRSTGPPSIPSDFRGLVEDLSGRHRHEPGRHPGDRRRQPRCRARGNQREALGGRDREDQGRA